MKIFKVFYTDIYENYIEIGPVVSDKNIFKLFYIDI